LRSAGTYSHVHKSLKGSSNSKCVCEAMDKTRSYALEGSGK